MRFKAILVPQSGEKAEQVFCEDLEQAKAWGRKTLWARHRKLVQAVEKGELDRDSLVPYILIQEFRPQDSTTVRVWDVTDADKKQESGE